MKTKSKVTNCPQWKSAELTVIFQDDYEVQDLFNRISIPCRFMPEGYLKPDSNREMAINSSSFDSPLYGELKIIMKKLGIKDGYVKLKEREENV